MRSLIRTTALATLLATAAGMALAHNCPNEMKAIDAKLATNPGLSADNAAKVKQLRADGEAHHKAGKHDDSMKALAEAKKILGI
jgi:Na+(H+)/acetate symporter ActP